MRLWLVIVNEIEDDSVQSDTFYEKITVYTVQSDTFYEKITNVLPQVVVWQKERSNLETLGRQD